MYHFTWADQKKPQGPSGIATYQPNPLEYGTTSYWNANNCILLECR